jgi:hypothetical protein
LTYLPPSECPLFVNIGHTRAVSIAIEIVAGGGMVEIKPALGLPVING